MESAADRKPKMILFIKTHLATFKLKTIQEWLWEKAIGKAKEGKSGVEQRVTPPKGCRIKKSAKGKTDAEKVRLPFREPRYFFLISFNKFFIGPGNGNE